ncbi:hypothetical protein F7725_001788 [Dissostichus mawsoni]|uniref:Uncharacterized protein n=1 Tax=Dissostichus mawsoni TaxID=36200 RepID=A0A7J5Y2C9_DISMA|nr:hypothetical protein F7725_001788 [Dissostichus mawsoni]
MDVNYLPLTDMRIARTFCFTNGGQALYLSSPTEIQRITYSQEMCDNLQEMLGELFTPIETPEAQNRGFLKGFFGGNSHNFDREELCAFFLFTLLFHVCTNPLKNVSSKHYPEDLYFYASVTFLSLIWRGISWEGFSQPGPAHPWAGGHGGHEGGSERGGGDLARARIALDERGQRLGELEDRTALMMTSADVFSKHAHELMLKCKDKKWYQF